MSNSAFDKPHFLLDSNATSQKFTTPSGGGGGQQTVIPPKDRRLHSGKLRGDLATVYSKLDQLKVELVRVAVRAGYRNTS